jgi:hypothetical protein
MPIIHAMDARMERVQAEISALPSNESQGSFNSKLREFRFDADVLSKLKRASWDELDFVS